MYKQRPKWKKSELIKYAAEYKNYTLLSRVRARYNLDSQESYSDIKDNVQSLLRTLESLFTIFVLIHVRPHKT